MARHDTRPVHIQSWPVDHIFFLADCSWCDRSSCHWYTCGHTLMKLRTILAAGSVKILNIGKKQSGPAHWKLVAFPSEVWSVWQVTWWWLTTMSSVTSLLHNDEPNNVAWEKHIWCRTLHSNGVGFNQCMLQYSHLAILKPNGIMLKLSYRISNFGIENNFIFLFFKQITNIHDNTCGSSIVQHLQVDWNGLVNSVTM